MATTLEKIQTLLSRKKKSKAYTVNFYAEMKLDDGRIIATEEESIAVGVAVKVLEDDGVAYPLDAGTYTLEDGTALVIADGGIVSQYGEVAETEEVVEEVMNEEVVEEVADTSVVDEVAEKIDSATPDEVTTEVAKEIAQEIVDHMAEKVEDAVAEVEEEETEEVEEMEKTEMSSMVGELITRLESVENKLKEIDETPAHNGVSINPTGDEYSFSKKPKDLFAKQTRKDVLKMTTSERAQFMIQNKITRI